MKRLLAPDGRVGGSRGSGTSLLGAYEGDEGEDVEVFVDEGVRRWIARNKQHVG